MTAQPTRSGSATSNGASRTRRSRIRNANVATAAAAVTWADGNILPATWMCWFTPATRWVRTRSTNGLNTSWAASTAPRLPATPASASRYRPRAAAAPPSAMVVSANGSGWNSEIQKSRNASGIPSTAVMIGRSHVFGLVECHMRIVSTVKPAMPASAAARPYGRVRAVCARSTPQGIAGPRRSAGRVRRPKRRAGRRWHGRATTPAGGVRGRHHRPACTASSVRHRGCA